MTPLNTMELISSPIKAALPFFSSLLYFMIVITLVVLPHELGHLLMALRARIRPLEFGLGLPPRLAAKKFKGMLFSLNAIPAGGFLRVAGMNPETESQEERYGSEESYMGKRVFDKILTVLGGPVMNLLFAALILFVVFVTFGSPTGMLNEIGSVSMGSEAERVGLAIGDRIVGINGKKISRIEDAIETIHGSAGKTLLLTIERGGKTLALKAVPQYNQKMKVGLLGFSPKVRYEKFGVLSALRLSVEQTAGMALLTLYFVWLLMTGGASFSDLAGPVGIAQISGQAAQGGVVSFLGFVAFFSVNLGILNLFPFPALDGGRIVILLLEAVRRKPVDRDLENKIHFAGMIVLMVLIIVVSANDLARLFGLRQ